MVQYEKNLVQNISKIGLKQQDDVINLLPQNSEFIDITEFDSKLSKKRDLLNKQLKLLHGDDYNADEVFSLNKKMSLNDD